MKFILTILISILAIPSASMATTSCSERVETWISGAQSPHTQARREPSQINLIRLRAYLLKLAPIIDSIQKSQGVNLEPALAQLNLVRLNKYPAGEESFDRLDNITFILWKIAEKTAKNVPCLIE